MKRKQPSRARFTIALVIAVGSLVAAVANAAMSAATTRGFAPLLALWDSESRGVAELRAAVGLWDVIFTDTHVDGKLLRIGRATSDALADFDLHQAYELLPEQDGEARRMRVTAGLVGKQYVLRLATPGEAFEANAKGKRRQLGDASLSLRMSQLAKGGDDEHYLVNADAAAVFGTMSWQGILAAHQSFLRVISETRVPTDSSGRPMSSLRLSALEANPRLDADEVETLATLWEAFPSSARVLKSLVRVDDLRVQRTDSGAQRMRLTLSLTPERLRERYPALASYISDLDRLLHMTGQVRDAHDRTIARWELDTQRLQARIDFSVVDGRLVPFDDKQDFVDQPVDLDHGSQRFEFRAEGQARVLGVRTRLNGIRGTIDFTAVEEGARIALRVSRVPKVEIDGAALGFVPTGLIDAFVPGDLNGLITSLMTTACQGNNGRGVTMDARISRGADGVSTAESSVGVELLDNFLIQLGVGYWNDHLRPDADVQADLLRLARDTHSAFSADFQRYARATTPRAL